MLELSLERILTTHYLHLDTASTSITSCSLHSTVVTVAWDSQFSYCCSIELFVMMEMYMYTVQYGTH